MDRLGPFGPRPRLVVGVSGGADSMALVVLADGWARAGGGSVLAVIVDHGMRDDSAEEAEIVGARLEALGIAVRVEKLSGLPRTARMQEMARRARYMVLGDVARKQGAVFLLVGHHERDQAETVAMRAARGPHGLEGMAAVSTWHDFVLLRPLLGVEPEVLRGYLRARGVEWVEDPSNADERFERVRVRLAGGGMAPVGAAGRREADLEAARFLAEHVTMRPEGFAVVHAGAAPVGALRDLMRAVGGAVYAPDFAAAAVLAGTLRAGSLGGVLVAKTAKFGGGWLVAREPAACAGAVDAVRAKIWDGRFRVAQTVEGAEVGAWGDDARRHPLAGRLPAVVVRGMACVRRGGEIVEGGDAVLAFRPPAPVTNGFWT